MIFITRKENGMYLKKSVTSVLAVLLSSSVAYAMPDATKGNPLDSLGIPTPAGVGDITVDHENPKTLHVGPASSKVIIGDYAELGSSGPQCSDYSKIKADAYRQKSTPAQQEQAYRNREFVSNWYQFTYALPRSSVETIRKISDSRAEMDELAFQNAGTIERFKAVDAKWKGIAIELGALEDEFDTLDKAQATETNTCIVSYSTNPTMLSQCIVGVITKYQAPKAAVTAEIDRVKQDRAAIRDEYYEAKGLYDAYEDKITRLDSSLDFQTRLLAAQSAIVKSAWEVQTDVVETSGAKITGLASAGYNLWENERDLLASTLYQAGHGDYSVKQLDVFNVRLNSGVTQANPTVEANNSPLFYKNVWTFPANTLVNKDVLRDWAMPFERELEGDTIHFDTMDAHSFASGGINFFVTRDARCGEYSEQIEEEYTGNENGVSASWSVKRKLYEPQPNRSVFVANLGLAYNYYAFPGEIKGECSIDVDRMNSYWRNAGKSKGWSWFRSKTRSWDHIREEAREELGMECSLDLKPQSNDPALAAEIAANLEAEMYNDMWTMFLSVYAESYDVVSDEPVVDDAGKSEVGAQLGDGITKFCKSAVCGFANVVLRTLDTIGGSKAQGTTSHVSTNYGKIWKRFNKRTWTVKEGSALVTAKVCVDKASCS